MIDLGINLFQEIAALGGGGGGYSISNSLRFNDDDSAYLSRTPASAGDRKTWTWSGWVKRGNLGARQAIFVSTNPAGSNYLGLEFRSDDKLAFASNNGSASEQFRLETNAVFRDVSGWYHIVVFFNSSDDTGSNRAAIYVNGVLQTYSYTTLMPKDYESRVNSTVQHNLGTWLPALSAYFDGYMSEVNFIDGQALTADDFGQIDEDTGEWSPKKYSGTYGTNGFYLEFKDGAALGDDTSGNTNDWTPTNLASTDQMLDTPTNNFSVFNALSNTSTLSEGNLKTTRVLQNTYYTSISNIGLDSGKWYAEAVFQGTSGIRFGITSRSNEGTLNTFLGNTGSWAYIDYRGQKQYNNGTKTDYGASYNDGDILGIALDMDSGTLTFYKNGVSQGVAFTGISGTVYIGVSIFSTTTVGQGFINFGADSSFAGLKTRQGNTDDNGIGDFYYTPPTGYLALCTDNLPEPAIVDSETQFNVVTYTGTGADRDIDVGFQPDMVWIKGRSVAYNHLVFDSVRGAQQALHTNLTNSTSTYTNALSSFNSNGFSYGADGTGNQLGATYVAWCMKAGGTAVTNNDGSITSQVSANVDAGFSIVTYTTTGGGSYTVGHGLSQKPDFIIVKRRNLADNWYCWHKDIGSNRLLLNTTDAATPESQWDSTDSSVISWSDGGYGSTAVAYAFHSVEGFSKIGTYVGNGSADGPFVYTGFRPAFVLYKRAIGGTGNWILADNKREGYNGDNPALYPNLNLAESISGTSIDLLSNGFKILNPNTDHNASGSTYIYMAFAEAPFKNAVAR